jgi:hypothetical protein
MKKSELRKIIRGLIKEHQIGAVSQNYVHGPIGHPFNSSSGSHGSINGRYVSTLDSPSGCNNLGTNGMAYSAGTGAWNNNFAPATYGTICMTVNGGQVPQQGQKIMIGSSEKVISGVYDHPFCYGNSSPCTIGDPGCPASQNGFYNPPGYAGTVGNFPDHQTVGDCQSTSSGCDPSAWSNHQNWITQFTSMPHFSSSNPNQPCNMICNKLQIWNNNLSSAGPVQTNQLNCKIAEGQNQSQIHGCNC